MQIRRFIQVLLVPTLLVGALFPAWAESIAPPMIAPEVGNTYFTRYTIFYEKDVHKATGFTRGQHWPINTEVRLTDMTDRRRGRMTLVRVDNGQEIRVQNVPRHTSISIEELASRLLSDQPTPIERLSEDFQTAMKAGQLRLGMTKEEAIMTRGYPPTTHTPTVDLDTWKYQVNRFAVHTIVFENGVITEGRDLR